MSNDIHRAFGGNGLGNRGRDGDGFCRDTIQHADGRGFIWVDAWEFERVFEKAESLWAKTQEMNPKAADKEKMETEAALLSERALNLYRGHFLLEDGDQFWTTAYRNRFNRKFVRLASDLAYHLQGDGPMGKGCRTLRNIAGDRRPIRGPLSESHALSL
jgi:hypothetical protein